MMKMYESEGNKLFLNGQDPLVASLFERLKRT
jgi:hypothetical protein